MPEDLLIAYSRDDGLAGSFLVRFITGEKMNNRHYECRTKPLGEQVDVLVLFLGSGLPAGAGLKKPALRAMAGGREAADAYEGQLRKALQTCLKQRSREAASR